MARVLGYGGIANTNGARDFSTKVEAEAPSGGSSFQVREEQTEPRWTKSWRLLDNWRNWVLLRE